MTRRKKLLLGLAAVLGSLVVADVVLSLTELRDGIFLDRPLPPFGAVTHPKQLEQNGSGIGEFDPDLGWTWRPSTASADGLARINALGARGPHEYEATVEPGKCRILFFGDSFTFCDEVPDDAAFEWILEKLDPRFEAINFGVSGYGTDQAFLRYRKVGKGLGAEVVVIGFLLENIGRNVNRYRPLWYPSSGFSNTKPRFVLDGSGALELLPQPYATREELRESILDGSVIDETARAAEALCEFRPSTESILDELLPMTVRAVLYQAFLDAAVSEQLMRKVAMKAATDNARDLGRVLNRNYNRARQTQITTELMEVVSGAVGLGS